MDIINFRRSVRSFIDRPLEQEQIEQLLRAGMQAPSAHNQQPWHFLVIQNKETLLKMCDISTSTKMFNEAVLAIVVLMDKTNLKRSIMAPQDLSAATQNILLKATELGIGSCWCGIYPIVERMDNLKAIINPPDYFEVFSLIALGYPKNENALCFIDRYNLQKITYEKF
ncbi:MAG: nitroreductase family protein [Bacilli bacterium]